MYFYDLLTIQNFLKTNNTLVMRATIKDISRRVGVSTATVDRVINGRPGVKKRTRAQVMAAALALGYLQEENIPARPRPLNLAVMLPKGTNAFLAALGEKFLYEGSELENVTVTLHELKTIDPTATAALLRALLGKCDGIAILAVDHPIVREAINMLADKGIPIATLLSDIPDVKRIEYVGVDNQRAGRLAGFVLGKFVSQNDQKVCLFTGSLAFRGHQEREMGFRQILSQELPHLNIVGMIESQDDRKIAFEATCKLLKEHPDLAGIYNAGGATLGIARALKKCGKAEMVHLIAHEVTADNTSLLLDGTIDACIDQNPSLAARETLTALANSARGIPYRRYPTQLHIVFRENLPQI